MRVVVTLTKIVDKTRSGKAVTGDFFIEGENLEFYGDGNGLLNIRNVPAERVYVTNKTYSLVAAILAAAPTTGGHFVLT